MGKWGKKTKFKDNFLIFDLSNQEDVVSFTELEKNETEVFWKHFALEKN